MGQLRTLRKEPLVTIDTAAVVFDAGDFDVIGADVAVQNWGVVGEEGWRYSRRLPSGGVLMFGVGGRGRLEASLPKITGPDNVRGLPLAGALEALRSMYLEAGDFIDIQDPFERAEVRRLDLTREFDGVKQFPLWASGVAAVRQAGRSVVSIHHDGELRGSLTVKVGTKTTWSAYCYDKHHESKGLAPPGRIRFEARLRDKVLQSIWAKDNGGIIRTVRNMKEESLAQLRRGMFERVGFDREVVGMNEVVQAIEECDLSQREKGTFLAFMVGRAYGIDVLSRNSAIKYDQIAKRLGLTVPVEALGASSVSVRLDYERGCEFTKAA
jgi:hypothetical protein